MPLTIPELKAFGGFPSLSLALIGVVMKSHTSAIFINSCLETVLHGHHSQPFLSLDISILLSLRFLSQLPLESKL